MESEEKEIKRGKLREKIKHWNSYQMSLYQTPLISKGLELMYKTG